MDENFNTEYEQVMPFVVCKSNGGKYDDESFVVGMRYAEINMALGILPTWGIVDYQAWVERDLIPQLDLLAMHQGWKLELSRCEEPGCEEDWFLASFTRVIEEDDVPTETES